MHPPGSKIAKLRGGGGGGEFPVLKIVKSDFELLSCHIGHTIN